MNGTATRIVIICIVIAAIAMVIILKNQSGSADEKTSEESGETFSMNSPEIQQEAPETNSSKINEQEIPDTASDKRSTERESGKSILQAEKDVLALVNGEAITQSLFDENFSRLPRQYQEMFNTNRDGYLDQLIIRELLIQAAIEKDYLTPADRYYPEAETGIQMLLEEITRDPEVTEEEMEHFYSENQSQMQGAPYEQVKVNIRNHLAQQKQNEMIDGYIEELRQRADVILNQEWIGLQVAARPENPLTEALQNGLPTVLDLGSDSCIPCKMMKPIFSELEQELAGKANILLLEIADYRNIANEYQVRVIPTQIFFDQNGEQYWRHEGFLSKEDILARLRETGAEL